MAGWFWLARPVSAANLPKGQAKGADLGIVRAYPCESLVMGGQVGLEFLKKLAAQTAELGGWLWRLCGFMSEMRSCFKWRRHIQTNVQSASLD
jgi:hypothetical protein